MNAEELISESTESAAAPGTSPLLPQHQALITASAISLEVASARGYRSVTSKTELAGLGFSKAQQRVPGLLIPIWNVSGQIAFYQLRPDAPRISKKGKAVKYETVAGSKMVVDVQPTVRAAIGDPKVDLWITEGTRKADSAVARGLLCVALLGVWNWRGTNDAGGKAALGCWDSIALHGRQIRIAFDSDVTVKKEVAAALARLKKFLEGRGAIVTVVYLPAGEGAAKVGLDDFLATHAIEKLLALVPSPSASAPDASVATQKPPSQSAVLLNIASLAELFCSPDGETAYADVTIGGHRETWPVRSTGFRRYLAGCYYAQEHKAPTPQAIQEAIAVIEAQAYYGGAPRRQVHTRVAYLDGAVYVDLANDEWGAIKITAAGWQAVSELPVRFRRTKAMLPLPTPVPGGSLDELRASINVKDEPDWKLLVGWLIGTINTVGSYPALVLGGEHGSAKSTAARVLRTVIDPNAAPLRAEPRNVENLIIAANNSWIVNLDNMECLQPWCSDALCRITTGGGLSRRELYTDDGESILNVKRPVILNGIEEIVTRPDLLSRSILVMLPTIPEDKRKPEREFWQTFDAAHPRILGALLDAASMALKRVGEVHFDRLPRMADFVIWVTAAEPALGWMEPDDFMAAYAGNRAAAHELALDASPLAGPIQQLMESRTEWVGSATELLETLASMVSEQARKGKGWPSAPNKLTGPLKRLIPNLRAAGIELQLPSRNDPSTRRVVTITKRMVIDAADAVDAAGKHERHGSADFADANPPHKQPHSPQTPNLCGTDNIADCNEQPHPPHSPHKKLTLEGGPAAQTIGPDDPANDLEPALEDML